MPERDLSARAALERSPVPPRGRQVSEFVRAKVQAVVDDRLAGRSVKRHPAGQYHVMDLDQPSRTIHTQTYSNTGPYTIERDGAYYELSTAEAARLQSFPPGYVFCGCNKAVRKQIGNAAPPEIVRRLAQSVEFM